MCTGGALSGAVAKKGGSIWERLASRESPSYLPPPPPAPAPPAPPLPAPQPLEEELNPQVRRARSKKARGSGGTTALRIPLKPNLNTGTIAKMIAGGMNK